MNLLIMHLSDIHFGENENFSVDNIVALTNVIRPSIVEVEAVLVIISGDLAFSGKKQEYLAMRNFLLRLKRNIVETYKIETVDFAIVPGNHDVDYAIGKLSNEDLNSIRDKDTYDFYLDQEYAKQKEFFCLSKMFGCFLNDGLLEQKKIIVGDKKIQINLLNTGVFSSLDEDQGFHYLPERVLNTLEEQTDADYVFTVMHHPSSWFNYRVTDKLESILNYKSDLIFVGHKHYETTRTVIEAQASVNILAGGMLSNRGNWTGSELHVGVLNLETRLLNIKKYLWNGDKKIYIEKEAGKIEVSKNRYNSSGFSVIGEYLDEYIKPDQYYIAENFLEYFVFPLLEEQKDDRKDETRHDINNMEDFVERLETSKRILVLGLKDSGKTALTKAVFMELSARKIVLMIQGSKVSGNAERTIKDAFYEIYGEDSTKYEMFKQEKPESLLLIIDDVDAIDESLRDSFIDYVNARFGSILETCQQDIELDIQSRLKKKYDRKDYAIFHIAPFYADKRRELVTKIIGIIGSGGSNDGTMITLLCDSLSKQKTLYNWSPSFIIQFTKYYYNNIGESSQNDGDVFSKVFENNLITLIKPYANKGITLEKIFMILDKIAYGIFKDHKYPISERRICEIVNDYNDKYDSSVKALRLLSALVSARVMKETDTGYLFYERSYLAYFIAREIRRLIQEGNYEDIKYVMKYSYMNIHADILLFVTYITDNLNIIRMLMEMAESTIHGWEEFSLSPININYMQQPMHLIVKPVEAGDREKEEQKHIEAEKEEKRALSIADDTSIFEGESEELNFIQEMLREISLMTTLARALPSFEHLMERKDKENCVALLYTMPLRIFYVWANEVDKSATEIVQAIKEFQEWEYRKDKPSSEVVDDQKALNVLRWESISLLLELMNAAFGYATKDNTWRFIDRYDYKSKIAYGIEHLMAIGKRDMVPIFVSEAVRLFDNKETQTKLMVQRVSRHYMVTSRKILYKDIQAMNSKLFGNQLKNPRLLIEQKKNKQKE